MGGTTTNQPAGGKGGGTQGVSTGQYPQLAALFGSAAPTAPAGNTTQTPAILPPKRPVIQQPARPPVAPPAATPQPMNPWSMIGIGGVEKPAWKTSLIQQPMGKPTMNADYMNYLKRGGSR